MPRTPGYATVHKELEVIRSNVADINKAVENLRVLVEKQYGEVRVLIERIDTTKARIDTELARADKIHNDMAEDIDELKTADKRWTFAATFLAGLVSAVISWIMGTAPAK